MKTHYLIKYLPPGSIYVEYIQECCLSHDSMWNGDEKLVCGYLFYNPNKKQFLFFSTYDEKGYNENSLHITSTINDFDPQNPTDEQANVVLDSRYCSSVADGDICTLEDIWFINDKLQLKHTQTIIL
jgi:hypothetical protein